jgi:hypothetical protein
VRRPIRKRDLLRRIEALEARLDEPTPAPMDGQQAINVGTISDHAYIGPGPCREATFAVVCGAHRDEHQLIGDEAC